MLPAGAKLHIQICACQSECVCARALVSQKGTKQIATLRNSRGMLVIVSNVFGFLVIACVCARARVY